MPNVVSDIVITPARVYYAAVGATVPADTVAVGGSWGAGWTEVGYTAAPVTFNYSFEELEADIQQSLATVKRTKTAEALAIETTLAELSLTPLSLGTAGTVTATPAGVGQPGKEELVVGGVATLTERMWGFEGAYIDEDAAEFPIRVFVYKGTAVVNGALEFGKAVQTGIPLQIKALADMGKAAGSRLFKISKILEPAS
jgi:hypothetical protein